MYKKSGTKKTARKDVKNPKSNFSSPASGTNNRGPKKWHGEAPPENGTHQSQRGHDYKEDSRGHEHAVEDKQAKKRAVSPQIKEHPVYVPPAMRNKKS